jgi:hypothetical protein
VKECITLMGTMLSSKGLSTAIEAVDQQALDEESAAKSAPFPIRVGQELAAKKTKIGDLVRASRPRLAPTHTVPAARPSSAST